MTPGDPFDEWREKKKKEEEESSGDDGPPDRSWRGRSDHPVPPRESEGGPSPTPCLVGAAVGVLPLEERDYTVGRAPTCDIHLLAELVSRVHARLEWRGKTHRIVDEGSKNGTLVNGEQVEKADLADEDRLDLGEVTLVYRMVHNVAKLERQMSVAGETTRQARDVYKGRAHGPVKDGNLRAFVRRVIEKEMTGFIKVEGRGIGGRIDVLNGEAVGGRYGQLEGRQAIVHILGLRKGEYAWKDGMVEPSPHPLDLEELLAEASQGETRADDEPGFLDELPG